MRWVIVVSLLVAAAAGAAEAPQAPQAPADEALAARNHVYLMANQGQAMTLQEVAAAEAHVAENPTDVDTRYKLLGFYKTHTGASVVETKRAHLSWMIKNRPEDAILATPYGDVMMPLEQDTYELCRRLWDEQIAAHPKSATILSNAARFEMRKDRERVTELLSRARALEPANPKWTRSLAGVYEFRVLQESRDSDRKMVYETYSDLYKMVDEDERLQLLPKMAMVSFNAEVYDEATAWAAKALASVEKLKPRNLHGEAINSAHTVYGLSALRAGDIEAAKRHLLASAQTPGSMRLNNFGPNLKLAQLLAMEGQRDTVIEFLNACSTFWVTGRGQIEEWVQVLKEGDTPDFGQNLRL